VIAARLATLDVEDYAVLFEIDRLRALARAPEGARCWAQALARSVDV
jgi:hypothetical protein